MDYGLDKWTVRQIENWMNCWAQKVVISARKYCWSPVRNGVNPESGTGATGTVQPGEGSGGVLSMYPMYPNVSM